MSEREFRQPASRVFATRSGGSTLFFIFGFVALVFAVGALLWVFVDFGDDDDRDAPMLATVKRGFFQHVVLVNGEIESSTNVDVRCEIKARGSSGGSTTILDIIPEGTLVQEGDWLLTLDSSVLEQEKLTEQIVLNQLESLMIKAKAEYDSASFDKEEYEARGLDRIKINLTSTASGRSASSANTSSAGKGDAANSSSSSNSQPALSSQSSQSDDSSSTDSAPAAPDGPAERNRPAPPANPSYGELKQFIENELSAADVDLNRAQLSFESTKRKVASALADKIQLESAQFRLSAARNSRDLTEQKLASLTTHTKQKLLVLLEANFRSSEVRYLSNKRSYEEQQARVKQIDAQVAKCRVVAPAAGQVVYKNVQSRRESSQFVVEPGAPVRQNQVIVMLPDPTKMQVKTLVDEERVNLLQVGIPATVRIDAFRSVHPGEVSKVNEFAASTSSWISTRSKQYLTLIRLLDFPGNIRAGLTAEVSMIVEERPDVIQMPFQAVYERGGKSFCLVRARNHWETREIVVSATNERMVVLDEGVQEGDQVVMNPAKHIDLFDHSLFPQEEDES